MAEESYQDRLDGAYELLATAPEKAYAEIMELYREDPTYSRMLSILGACCMHGWGTKPDRERAMQYYAESVKDGSPAAEYIYATELESERDPACVRWYEAAAQQGNGHAAYSLANLYNKGTLVEKDAGLWQKWLEKAAEAENRDAMYELGVAYLQGTLDTGTPARNDALGCQWTKKAAEAGDATAMYNMSIVCRTGTGMESDSDAAFAWAVKAFENGMPRGAAEAAMNKEFCGRCYLETGKMGAKAALEQYETAQTWAEKYLAGDIEDAAERQSAEELRRDILLGSGSALHALGEYDRALTVLSPLAQRGNPYALLLCGCCYAHRFMRGNDPQDLAFARSTLRVLDDGIDLGEERFKWEYTMRPLADGVIMYTAILRLGNASHAPDVTHAHDLLARYAASVKHDNVRAYLYEELKKYQPKMFGGYRYAG